MKVTPSLMRCQSTLVLVEHDGKKVLPATRHALSAAKKVGGEISCLVAGPDWGRARGQGHPTGKGASHKRWIAVLETLKITPCRRMCASWPHWSPARFTTASTSTRRPQLRSGRRPPVWREHQRDAQLCHRCRHGPHTEQDLQGGTAQGTRYARLSAGQNNNKTIFL